MSFIRPEARAAIWRWRELLAGSGLAALGLYWIVGPGLLLGWLGWLLTVAGGAMIVVGLQRARFRTGSGGVGVVMVDEGEISYLGPLTGGSAAAADLDRVSLDRTARPAHWVLERRGQTTLFIPVNAEGADALFDAFASLPGLRTEHMLAELNRGGSHPVVIWERGPKQPSTLRLH